MCIIFIICRVVLIDLIAFDEIFSELLPSPDIVTLRRYPSLAKLGKEEKYSDLAADPSWSDILPLLLTSSLMEQGRGISRGGV